MRCAGILLCFWLWVGIAAAEEFQGRLIEIVDGRADAAPAPLVLALNGYRGDSEDMRNKTGFDDLAERHGFVVAYANGVQLRWNDGRSPRNRVDDVGYLSALIEALVAQGRVDPARVYIVGHSNGGGMAMRMACDRPDLVTAIAVVATKVLSRYQCANGEAVPAIFFYGTLDPIAPPEGRPVDHRLGGALSADQSIAVWSARNGCAGIASTQRVDIRDDGTFADIVRFSGCRAGLAYVTIDGHGHSWPGAGRRLPRLMGPASQEIDAASLSWWFFERQ